MARYFAAVAAVLVSVLSANSIPLPIVNPVAHQLATFATTKSFQYYTNTNKPDGFNYQFPKQPQQYPFDIFSKYFLPQVQSYVPSTGQSDINNVGAQAGGNTVNQVPDFGNSLPASTDSSLEPVPPYTLDIKVNEPSTGIEEIEFDGPVEPSVSLADENSETSVDSKFQRAKEQRPLQSNEGLDINREDQPITVEFDSKGPVSEPGIGELFRRVQNIPVRKVSVPESTPLEEPQPNMETRQDSTVEQPRPFFSSFPRKLNPQTYSLNNRVNPPGLPHFNRFRVHSPSNSAPTPHQQSGFVPAINRFAPQRNIPLQTPYPRRPQQPFPGNSVQQESPQQGQSPYLSQPSPQFPLSHGAPTPEPENGYNPFHQSDFFPEPPYESEFARLPPENDFADGHTQRSSSPEVAHQFQPRPQLDFAQDTLRNIKTEELLQVVRRKQVPRDCAYNTISYGANGEDCVQVRKK